ncbi:hypothetical protein ACA910_017616 [Epithemia clementina (nom. ined.)]
MSTTVLVVLQQKQLLESVVASSCNLTLPFLDGTIVVTTAAEARTSTTTKNNKHSDTDIPDDNDDNEDSAATAGDFKILDDSQVNYTIDKIDELLSNEQLFERTEIRGAPHKGSEYLGDFWFQTDALIQATNNAENSHLIRRYKNSDKIYKLNEHQKKLFDEDMDDGTIDPQAEKARCARYNFPFHPRRTTRRRIFFGAPLADDSFFLLQVLGTEAHHLFHTAAFIESNLTHSRTPRKLRFPPRSENVGLLQSLFGTKTMVTVDYFSPVEPAKVREKSIINFDWQHLHREAIVHRWKRQGMRPDDIGVVSDCDEFFSRDFLRALQICDIPEFKPHQDCLVPKILSTALIYEASPECIISNTKLWHPDAILGECLEGIGDSLLHPLAERGFHGNHARRHAGYGLRSNYTLYLQEYNQTETSINTIKDAAGRIMYPLWSPSDIRSMQGGRQVSFPDHSKHSHNGFHLHNFFESSMEIRHKYSTYGEPLAQANQAPLTMIHDDLGVAVSCVHGWQNHGKRKYFMGGDAAVFPPTLIPPGMDRPQRPILFDNEEIRISRHEHLSKLIQHDIAKYGIVNASCASAACKN